MFEDQKKFIELTRTALRILDTEAEWDTKFALIFSDDISGAIAELSCGDFEYYDPDTTYEEDTRAYVNALVEKAQQFERALSFMGGEFTLSHDDGEEE